LTIFQGNLAETQPFRQAIVEPAVILAVLWGLAIWIR
jgi:hypothetical protein